MVTVGICGETSLQIPPKSIPERVVDLCGSAFDRVCRLEKDPRFSDRIQERAAAQPEQIEQPLLHRSLQRRLRALVKTDMERDLALELPVQDLPPRAVRSILHRELAQPLLGIDRPEHC